MLALDTSYLKDGNAMVVLIAMMDRMRKIAENTIIARTTNTNVKIVQLAFQKGGNVMEKRIAMMVLMNICVTRLFQEEF